MPSLLETQRRLARALFDEDEGAPIPIIRENGVAVAERVEIYRNNLREGFRKALALEFPVIERLVGEDYFRQLAREFLAAHPSRNGDLHHVGAPFESFLRERFGGTPYGYFADVAALEWAHCEVLVAADAGSAGIEFLASVPAERYGDLRFSLAPACALVRSEFPLLAIWDANQPGANPTESIDLGSGGVQLLVRRGATDVEFHALDVATADFAAALARGATLEVAFDAAQRMDASFDLGATLQHLVALGALITPTLETTTAPN